MDQVQVNCNTVVSVRPEATYVFSSVGATSRAEFDSQSIEFDSEPLTIYGKKIVPFGCNNNLPIDLRQMLENNNLAPGILKREKGLLWGQGPTLFEEVIENNQKVRKWESNTEIQSFLDDIDYEDLIDKFLTEYKYIAGIFVKYYRNQGMRIGNKGIISNIKFESSKNARLQWVESRKLEDVKEIYVADWQNQCRSGVQTYKVFDKDDPFRHPTSMYYYNSYTFGRDMYSSPDYWGSRHWIQRSSDIPILLKSLTDNSLSPTYQIIVPVEYWEDKESALKEKATQSNTQYNPNALELLKKETFEAVSEVMGGKANAGKFFTSVSFPDERGNRVSWQVEPIEYKAKEFIEAQIKIGEMADAATMSGISVHPTLANTAQNGNSLSSGSENLYAFKVYLASDTAIPERIVMQAINTAIKINFPSSRLKLGFYHDVSATQREEDISPQNRLTNQ